jgi:hypothetical protein
MSETWSIAGEYMEACSCNFVCPCIVSNATGKATEDFCTFAMTYRVDSGRFASTNLAGVTFALIAKSKAVMSAGEWIMGVVVDDRASDEQTAAIGEIASGAAGGPMAAFAPLVAEFRGIERHPIRFEIDGLNRSVKIGKVLEETIEGVPSPVASGECLAVDNTFHPANKRLNLATVQKNFIDCFGLRWDDSSGQRNGHFARVSWRGERA